MSLKNIIFFVLAVAIVGIMMSTLNDNDEAYVTAIKSERKTYFTSLKNDKKGPFSDLDSINELDFYPPNPKYKTKAKVILKSYPKKIIITSTDGTKKNYLHMADLEFSLSKTTQILALFRNEKNVADFFLPFRDATNENTTYGAGRYLPVDFNGETEIEIDFNRAFNPYCAYNDKYACPIPPIENTLNIKIEAGEKLYKKD